MKQRRICAICWVDPETGLAGTNATTWICKPCSDDPVNADWVESWEAMDDDIEATASVVEDGMNRLSLVIDKKIREETVLQKRIIELSICGLPTNVYIHRDKKGRRRGLRRIRADLTNQEIAWLVGCDVAYVYRVRKRTA